MRHKLSGLIAILLLSSLHSFGFTQRKDSLQDSSQGMIRQTMSFDQSFTTLKPVMLSDLYSKQNTSLSQRGQVVSLWGDSLESQIILLWNTLLNNKHGKVTIQKIQKDRFGNTHLRLQQWYKNCRVIGADMIAHVNKKNELYAVHGMYVPRLSLSLTSFSKSEKIISKVLSLFNGMQVSIAQNPPLVILNGTFAYEFTVRRVDGIVGAWNCFIDAKTGSELLRVSIVRQQNTVHLQHIDTTLPGDQGNHVYIKGVRLPKEDGKEVSVQGWHVNNADFFLYNTNVFWRVFNDASKRWESRPTDSWEASDPAAVSLGKNLETVQQYLYSTLNHRSFNDSNAFATAHVHYGDNVVDAYWDGTELYFGDGDDIRATSLTSLDVVAHEYGHALTQYTSDLLYLNESGALNESYSDIFATIVEFYAQPDGKGAYPHAVPGQADWLIGEDCWIESDALRDLRNPQRYENPSLYKGRFWYSGTLDYGGVHTNSNVQNFAFYLLTEGGVGVNDGVAYSINGLGVKASSEIALYANMYLLTSLSQYKESRQAWILAAATLGYDTAVVAAVWDACGVVPFNRSLDFTPKTIAFGPTSLGKTVSQQIQLCNEGTDPLTIHSIISDNNAFWVNEKCPLVLNSKQSRTCVVYFKAVELSNYSAQLHITSNASNGGSFSVPLTGYGALHPVLNITPTSLADSIKTGKIVIKKVFVTNKGSSALDFKISYDLTNANKNKKGMSGGPDSYGYRWKDSDERNGPVFDWNDISTVGKKFAYSDTSTNVWECDLSFHFSHYDSSFTKLFLSKHGFIALGKPNTNNYFDTFPSRYTKTNVIAPLYVGYLYPNRTNCIYFKDFGDKAVIQYDSVVIDYWGSTATFQVVLEKNGQILFYYKTVQQVSDTLLPLIGMQNNDGSSGLTIPEDRYNRRSYIKSRFAVQISTAINPWLKVTPVNGSISSNQTKEIFFTFDGTQLLPNLYTVGVQIDHNDPSVASPFSIPCSLHVAAYRDLEVLPVSLDFKKQWVWSKKTLAIEVRNRGNAKIVIDSIASTNPDIQASFDQPFICEPFSQRAILIQSAPQKLGSFQGVLTLYNNSENNPQAKINTMTVIEKGPEAVLTPQSIVFNAGYQEQTKTSLFTLKNSGAEKLQYTVSIETEKKITNILSINTKRAPPNYSLIYNKDNYKHPFVSGELICALKGNASSLNNNALLSLVGVETFTPLARAKNPLTKQLSFNEYSLYVATLRDTSKTTLLSAIEVLRADENVVYVEPNYTYTFFETTPNDQLFVEQYALYNNGQTGGTSGADIKARAAWDSHRGNKSIVIGIDDTGIDYLHPDLASNIWRNPGEIPANGMDDDGNGFVDDIYGWDFGNNDNDPMDHHGHGSHCSGICAGTGNNHIGICGVMWEAQLAAIKIGTDEGGLSLTAILNGINYAQAMNMAITSNSWGGGPFSQALYDLIARGNLFIFAAANDGSNNDIFPVYPASFDLDNILTVAATDHNDALTWWSNYGKQSVDVAAPGNAILSCSPGGGYVLKSGTSMATPCVAGLAGLLWSYDPQLTVAKVKEIILSSVDTIPSLVPKILSGGRVNAAKAIQMVGPQWISVSPKEPDSLSPLLSKEFMVAFQSQQLVAGQYNADIVFKTNDPGKSEQKVSVVAHVTGYKKARLETTSLSFEKVWIGRTKQLKIRVFNEGNDSTTITAIQSSSSEYACVTSLPVKIPAFGITDVEIVFKPTRLNRTIAQFDVQTDAADNPSLSFQVSGQGIKPPTITLDTSVISLTTIDSITVNRTIINTGSDNLFVSISTASSAPFASVKKASEYPLSYYANSDKEKPDQRIGKPVQRQDQGPDSFGYRWLDSHDPKGPQFQWNDITSTGQKIVFTPESFKEVPLSFAFHFYGKNFTSLFIHSEGYITFGEGFVDYLNKPIPFSGKPNALIAGFWDDLEPQNGNNVYVQNFPDKCIVQFDSVPHWFCDGSGCPYVTFQMVINKNGDIYYYYRSLTNNENGLMSPTIGIENLDGTDGLEIAFNTAYVHDSLAVRIFNTENWLSVYPGSFTLQPSKSQNIAVTIYGMELNAGLYTAQLQIQHNDPQRQNPLTIPLHATIVGLKQLAFSPTRIDFSKVSVGQSKRQPLTIINTGRDTTLVSNVLLSNALFSVEAQLPISLAPGDSARVVVTFTPDKVRQAEGIITIISNADVEQDYTITCSGRGIVGPRCVIAPLAIQHTLDLNTSVTDDISISNPGDDTLYFSAATQFSVSDASTLYQTDEKPALIQPTQRLRTPQIQRTVVADKRSSKPSFFSRMKSTQSVNQTQTVKVLYLTTTLPNNGEDSFVSLLKGNSRIRTVDVLSGASQSPNLAYMLQYDIIFAASQSAWADPVYIGNTLAQYIDAGGKVCLFNGTFDQTEQSPWSLQGAIVHETYLPLKQASSGNPSTLARVNYHRITFGVGTFISVAPIATSETQGSGKELGRFDTEYLIGAYNQVKPLVVLNMYPVDGYWDGDVDILIDNTIGWLTSTMWLKVHPARTLMAVAPNETKKISAVISSNELEAKTYSGTISLFHSNLNQNSPVRIPVSLTVRETRELTVSSTLLDFGSVSIGDRASRLLTVSNTGNTPITVDDVEISKPVFSHDLPTPVIIAPFSQTTIRVSFAPEKVQSMKATLVMYSDANADMIVVNLKGRGIEKGSLSQKK